MIDSIIRVQPNLPPQKEVQREARQKDEVSSFANKMSEQDSTKVKTDAIKQEEELQEKQAGNICNEVLPKEAQNTLPQEDMKKEKIEELFLAVSGQMVALGQLHVQPTLLYQYIQKLQKLYQSYGNVKLNELPAAELQQLQSLFANQKIENFLCLEETIQTTLEKVMMPEKWMNFTKDVETEIYDLTKNGTANEMKSVKNSMQSLFDSDHPFVENVSVDVNGSTEAGNQQLGPSFIEGLSTMKSDKLVQAETVTLPELGKNIEAKVEMLQKFVVKQERVLFQLNPEKLGEVTVYMRKQGDQIQVHVELDKHDAKKSIEAIFDELKLRLKEKEIHIELSYADKEQKREEHPERQQSQKRRQDETMKQEQGKEQSFAGLLEE